MPRKKRAQKLAEQVVKPAPRPVVTGVIAQQIIGCFCPVCGKTIHENRPVKVGYVKIGETPYFDSITWDEAKAFGLVFEASGRGSLHNWKYINPEDAPELFEAVKMRFLQALREWLNKRWVTAEEIRDIVSEG